MPKLSSLFVDTETRCAIPIERGNDLYCRAAHCMIITYARGERPVQGIDLMDPLDSIPAEFEDAYLDERVTKIAHNAPFDWAIFAHATNLGGKWKTPIEQWQDTQCMAYSHGLPGSLETLGLILQLPQDKAKLVEDGKLIHTFCVPYDEEGHYVEPWDEPEKWQTFFNYAMRDTETLREVWRRLPKHNYRHD